MSPVERDQVLQQLLHESRATRLVVFEELAWIRALSEKILDQSGLSTEQAYDAEDWLHGRMLDLREEMRARALCLEAKQREGPPMPGAKT